MGPSGILNLSGLHRNEGRKGEQDGNSKAQLSDSSQTSDEVVHSVTSVFQIHR